MIGGDSFMKESINWIITNWKLYWGDGSFQYLLLAAIIYLIGWKRKKRSVQQVLLYLLAGLLLFICPLTATFIQKCIGETVYWRVLWILPVTPVIALAGAEFPENRHTDFLHSGLIIIFISAAVICANSLLHSGNYTRTYNHQKVPDEVANICNLVQENAQEGTEVCLAADDHVASYVRVYDPSIIMPYGRRTKGSLDQNSRSLYQAINADSPDYGRIAELAADKDCSFISVAIPENFDAAGMESMGYTLIGTVNQYGVFKRMTA